MLLLVSFRPEFVPPWIGQPHVTALTINRLTEREVCAMIDRIGGNALVPESIRQDIIERTDGIPLFIEEMTKAVLEADSQGAIARTVASMPSPALSVPASLHASLMARLDRLGSAKEIAQFGAAIGREFFPRLTGCGRQQVGTRVGIGPGASHGGRVAVSAGTRLMARFCASPDARFTRELQKRWTANLPILRKANPSCWHSTGPRPG